MTDRESQTTKPHQYTQEEIDELQKTDPQGAKRCEVEGFHCGYVAPYGFVAEAGCPRHD